MSLQIITARKAGRCANGNEAGQGSKVHALTVTPNDNGELWGRAICGTRPGRRSVGWTNAQGAAVTCDRCKSKPGQAR